MNMQQAIIATLTDSGPGTFVDLIGATVIGAEDFNINILPSVLYLLVRDCVVVVDGGLYSLDNN